MTSRTETLDIASDRVRRRALDFLELTKPRVVLMVLVTTTGKYLPIKAAEARAMAIDFVGDPGSVLG